MRRVLVVVTALGLALGVGCGGGDDGGGAGASADDGGSEGIEVEGNEFSFEPSEITAPAGKVTLTLKNTGSLEHDITIDEPKLKVKALANQTKSGSVDLEAGTYEIYCSVAGHETSGMKGTLTVE